ncbi:MAG: hypothetical protein KDA31_13395 [Phycisphaerales bacterium]|nr:hypothetical protein [Phycisphaerales bacterium]MCB9836209.1 hypothetical protein [Phycisphaera sp.]
MTSSRIAVFFSLCLSALLVGCSPISVKGRVIAGQLSVITAVPTGDARLAQEGIPDVRILAVQQINNNRTTPAVSGKHGDFSIPLKGDAGLAKNLTFSVEADGYLPVRVEMPTPTPQQRLLIVLKPLRSSSE